MKIKVQHENTTISLDVEEIDDKYKITHKTEGGIEVNTLVGKDYALDHILELLTK